MVVGVLTLVGAACSTPPREASNAVPAPAEIDQNPVVWAALGGDETTTAQSDAAQASWTRVVLAGLPTSAQLLDVATADATVEDALDAQLVALRASSRLPTVATVWLGRDEPGTDPSVFADRLTRLVGGLTVLGVPRVVLIARSDAPPDRGGQYTEVIQAVASATGATYADLKGLPGNLRDPVEQQDLARALAPYVVG
jgi:hypothetical protein